MPQARTHYSQGMLAATLCLISSNTKGGLAHFINMPSVLHKSDYVCLQTKQKKGGGGGILSTFLWSCISLSQSYFSESKAGQLREYTMLMCRYVGTKWHTRIWRTEPETLHSPSRACYVLSLLLAGVILSIESLNSSCYLSYLHVRM